MKKALLLVLFALLVPAGVMANGSPKINICHRTNGSSPYVQTEISVSALGAHLAHPWGPDVYPVPEGGCGGLNVTPEPTPTSTQEPPTATPTDNPAPEPTPSPTVTSSPVPTATDEPTATPTVVVQKECPYEEIGELFLLIGPDGQRAWFGSYQRNPNTGNWALPNTASQQKCLGWIAVDAPAGKIIYADCNGNVNYVTIPCEGGGPCYAHGDN